MILGACCLWTLATFQLTLANPASAADPLQQPARLQTSPGAVSPSLLRWRPMQTADRSVPALKLNTASGRKASILPVVANQLPAEQDPFNDPFGDLEQTKDRPLSIIEPPRVETSQPALDPPANRPRPTQLPPTPTKTQSFPLQEILPPEPLGGDTTSQATLDCQKLDCNQLRKQLQHTSIQQISLNITPTFNPNIKEPSEKQQVITRTWTDSTGDTLATGKLVDYRFNQALIQTDEGPVVKISVDRLSQKDLCYLADAWGIPVECPLDTSIQYSRDWTGITMMWKASALCHKPLYFEQVQLERYGHTTGPFSQPFFSGGHFVLNIATLPYKMGINPMNECQYALGYYRPGSCAPWLLSPIPLSLRGGLTEAAFIFGGGALLP